MTSVPFPTFTNILKLHDDKQLTASTNNVALECVGRCCLDLTTLLQSADDNNNSLTDELKEIVAACTLQALADQDSTRKAEAKKYMKQSVALAKTFIHETMHLDASIINIDVVLSAQSIVATNGCLVSCWLDAGCTRVVVAAAAASDSTAALQAARVPRERLGIQISDLSDAQSIKDTISTIAPQYCASVTLVLTSTDQLREQSLLDLIKTAADVKDTQLVFQCPLDNDVTDDTELGNLVSSVCKLGNEGVATVSLECPTATQLGTCYAACMKTDRPDGLYTTVVCTRGGEALGLVYSSVSSIIAALECGRGVYYSRSRNGLWRKGDTSGHYQILHRIDVDCDGDALRFVVTQRGDDHAAFCHLNTLTCWGPPVGIRHLQETLQQRLVSAPEGSYTQRLFNDNALLRNKLVEEAQELSEADTKQHVAEELADVLYFSMVKAVQAGISIDDAIAELDARTRKVTRRPGDSKEFRIAAGKAILEKEGAK